MGSEKQEPNNALQRDVQKPDSPGGKHRFGVVGRALFGTRAEPAVEEVELRCALVANEAIGQVLQSQDLPPGESLQVGEQGYRLLPAVPRSSYCWSRLNSMLAAWRSGVAQELPPGGLLWASAQSARRLTPSTALIAAPYLNTCVSLSMTGSSIERGYSDFAVYLLRRTRSQGMPFLMSV